MISSRSSAIRSVPCARFRKTPSLALGSGPVLQLADLPSNLHASSSDRLPASDELLPLEELERRAIFRALRETGGDKLAAARLLGIGKTTLYRKLKQYEAERQPA
ncbi:MAG: hypothetical protein K6U02_10390 [Firmicutes bacterium]|nr:hypothetical protein [Bacillota bacterium]